MHKHNIRIRQLLGAVISTSTGGTLQGCIGILIKFFLQPILGAFCNTSTSKTQLFKAALEFISSYNPCLILCSRKSVHSPLLGVLDGVIIDRALLSLELDQKVRMQDLVTFQVWVAWTRHLLLLCLEMFLDNLLEMGQLGCVVAMVGNILDTLEK